jgi:DNA modification methylase
MLQHETWPIDKLIPYIRNPRKNDAAVERMVSSIKEFGFRIPVVAKSDGTVVDGHLRLKAAHKMGLSEVPVVLADELTEVQVKAFRLLANRSANWAEWDEELLKVELEELQELDFDLAFTGFDAREFDSLLAIPAEHGDPEYVPETSEAAISVPGDIWALGNHRLMCGDCTDAAAVTKLLNDVAPLLCVTDPPYGVEYDADWRNHAFRPDGTGMSARAIGKVLNDDRTDWSAAFALFPGDVLYAWSPPGSMQFDHYSAIIASGFEIRMQIIWAKSQLVIGRGHYHVQHEPCWYAVRKGKTAYWQGDRKQTTLWNIPKPQKSETGHSTQKPIECMKRPIENNSSPGQAVYEPFSGSGTTLIACEMTGRACYAMELNPLYVDIAVKRWETFTGQKAVHAEAGRAFNE